MSRKILIFIPYQDTDNFYSDGILTREFAILYMLYNAGYKNVVNIKKPRTILDKKRYTIDESNYPKGTIEYNVKQIVDHAITLQNLKFFSLEQIVSKREWWINGYVSILNNIKRVINTGDECLVYSNNPFAVKLVCELKSLGCKVYFDVMDNFAIHPSLKREEQLSALEGYKKIFHISDVVSANSQQTCEYMQKYSSNDILLVKNGVFFNSNATELKELPQLRAVRAAKQKYRKIVGYIGKIGKRLDEDLIGEVSKLCPEDLFVFVGPYLKGQMNKDLVELFETQNNVLHLEGVPSAYVYTMLKEFDILMIPKKKKKNENGGDPLKLYQYLTQNKPIITTAILGVDEFKKYIEISNSKETWSTYIHNCGGNFEQYNEDGISWEKRIKPVMDRITKQQ